MENKFPILGSEPKEYIPLSIIKLHEKQVTINHMQTLERLAERGGLSWNETLFVLKDKAYNRVEQVSEADARTKVLEAISVEMVNCNECKFISITEEEQHSHNVYKLDHRCLKHGHNKLFHRNNHKGIDNFIYPCKECNGIDFMKNMVSFCMRCFGNSAVPVNEDTNFCHNCRSEGTCIAIKKDEADYLRENIQYAIKRAKQS